MKRADLKKDNSSGDDGLLLLTPFPSQSMECRQDPCSVLRVNKGSNDNQTWDAY